MRKVESVELATGEIRYKVRFRYRGTQTSERFNNHRQAERFAAWLEVLGPQAALDQLAADEGEGPRSDIPSLNQVAAEHFAILTDVTNGTRLNYQRLWSRTWGKRIGDLPADAITRDVVAKTIIDLARTYSGKSLKNQRGLLAGVCGRAVELGHLSINPARGIRLPRQGEHEREDMRLITDRDFEQLQQHIRPHYRPLVTFLYGTGCRWGEAVALLAGDVDLPRIRIRRALKWSPDSNRTVGPTKTAKSNRTVIAPSAVCATLEPLLDGKAPTDLVFTAPRGGQVQHRTFWSDIWQPAVKAAGLEPRPRIHDLRHSHASNLLGRGIAIHVVQARLGHSDITTTVNTYGHLLPDAQAQAAAAAELAFLPQLEEG
jgi:integrase